MHVIYKKIKFRSATAANLGLHPLVLISGNIVRALCCSQVAEFTWGDNWHQAAGEPKQRDGPPTAHRDPTDGGEAAAPQVVFRN